MKYLTFLLVACLGYTGCVVVDGEVGGSAGSAGAGVGASGGAGGSTGGTAGSEGGTGGSTGGAGGTGGAACISCAEAVTPDANPDMLDPCAGESADLYDTLVTCICEGACMDLCTDNICAGADVTQECQNCILGNDPSPGCGAEFSACSNDAG